MKPMIEWLLEIQYLPTAADRCRDYLKRFECLQPRLHSSPEHDANQRLIFPDGLRACAATWVVFYHFSAGNHIPSIKALMPARLFDMVFANGRFGVPIFFVLSGFVMAYTYTEYPPWN